MFDHLNEMLPRVKELEAEIERLREENARLHRIEEAVKEQFEFNEDGMTDALRTALEEEKP